MRWAAAYLALSVAAGVSQVLPVRSAHAELDEAPPQPSPVPIAPPIALPTIPLPGTPLQFRGTVTNETMGQSGQMSLVITRRDPSSSEVTARFHAWGGLIGEGELVGRLLEDGRIVASGQLMMGRNPFDCELSGRVAGDTLAGSAIFTRSGGDWAARSRFTLTRS